METWSKKNLFECVGKVVFDNEFGYGILAKPDYKKIVIKTSDNQSLIISDLFCKKDGTFRKLDILQESLVQHVEKQDLFVCTSFIKNEFSPISVSSLLLELSVRIFSSLDDLKLKANELRRKDLVLELGAKEFVNYQLFCFEDRKKLFFFTPGYSEIKVSDELYHFQHGIVKVAAVYSECDEFLCDIVTSNNETFSVKHGDPDLLTTPDKFIEILSPIKEKLEESSYQQLFNICVEKSGGRSASIFYQNIEGSKKYVVDIKKIVKQKSGYVLYSVKEYEFNKSEVFYLPLEEYLQFGKSLFARITALDETNKVVAKTEYIQL